MKNNLKSNYKEAYYLLTYIEEINPNFNKTRNLIQECIDKGRHNILVEIFNNSDKIIPEKLENDILDFETYGLKSLWQSFYSKRTRLEINYDYKVTKININKDEQFKPEFKKLSPFSKIPVIIDHETKTSIILKIVYV